MSDAEAVRRRLGLFPREGRSLLEVTGPDRERWLEGQLSQALPVRPGPGGGGAYAFVLSPIGRIVADVHVIARPEATWLELDARALEPLLERLHKFLIADDVELRDRSAEVVRLGIEGPRTPELLERLTGSAIPLALDDAFEIEIAGAPVVVGVFGESGETALQWVVPAGAAGAVLEVLRPALEQLGGVLADDETLEVLRVEAGTPRFGAELDEGVLPAETGLLERAVSFTKGCYVGQEVVARMHSRGRVAHRLVGLRLAREPAAPGTKVHHQGQAVGEVTSSVLSPAVGPIALAYVRLAHAAPGGQLEVGGQAARVSPLPLVAPGTLAGASPER